MKTIIACIFSLTLLFFASCSKKSPVNNDTQVKFPDNIASTWSKSVISYRTDTFTNSGSDQKWVKDKVILTTTEAAKLQELIISVPQSVRDNFATKFKKFTDKLHSPEIAFYSDTQHAMDTQEYKDFGNFCATNEKSILPLAMAFLFNDTDESSSNSMATWCMDLVLKGKFEDLRKEAVNEMVSNPKTPDGKYIISYGFLSLHRRLAKKIINQL